MLVIGGGTAYAARHYLISSLSQIKPSVRKELRGPAGARGKAGPAGGAGLQGAVGAGGAAGAAGTGGQPGGVGATGATGSSAASVLSGRITTIPLTAITMQSTVFGAGSGTSLFNLTESSVQTLSANATFTAQNLSADKTGAAVPAGDQITVDLDVNGSAELTCAIAAGQTSCNSGSTTFSVAAGSELSIKVAINATNASVVGFDLLFGYQAA